MIHNDYGKVCSSCIIYIVLFDIAFLITTGISSACFYFNWYLKKVIICVGLISILNNNLLDI